MSKNSLEQPENQMQFSYGGQAVIEGIMMRGAHSFAVAARDPEGHIIVHESPINKTLYRGWVSKTPFVRGVIGLWDALGLGIRALLWSANIALDEEDDIDFNGPIGFMVVLPSLLLGVGLFFVLPTAIAAGIENYFELTSHLVVNFIEGVVRLIILIAYIGLTGLIPDMKRVFSYHGAEHKTINAYEAGAELTPEVVAQYPIEHPRCGTAFLLIVVFVSVLVYSLLGEQTLMERIVSRVILIPVIAGIAYEYLRFTAKHLSNPIIRFLIIPNLALQHLTTRTPDLDMIEVGIAAFKRVLLSEGLISEEEAAIPTEAKPQNTSFSKESAA